MKKIMIMFAMMVAVMFASPLFALDGSPPGVEKNNSMKIGDIMYGKNGLGYVDAARADNKVAIYHKDTLMYSCGEADKEMTKSVIVNKKVNMNASTYAVVCYPRGEIGV